MESPILFIVAFVLVIVMYFVGHISGIDREQNRAVRAGAAEYYLDTGHARQFRYITNHVKP